MQTTASLSRAVLALSLIWRGATSYTPLGSIVAAHPRDVVRAGGTEQRCFPRPRNAVGILKSSSGGNCHASSDRKNGSSTPPAEGGSSRGKFLRQLIGSSVAVIACSSVVGATGATASAVDSVPDGERRDAISGLVSAFYAVWSHVSRHERREVCRRVRTYVLVPWASGRRPNGKRLPIRILTELHLLAGTATVDRRPYIPYALLF